MNSITFTDSLKMDMPPQGLSPELQAMWHEAKGDWEKAHDLVDGVAGQEAAWIHAYLHRVEGDVWNADYWYRKANRKRPGSSLQDEWKEIVSALCGKG